MPELGSSGSVRGALRNERPYRERYSGSWRCCPIARLQRCGLGSRRIRRSGWCRATAAAATARPRHKALPDALQVADRWNLMENASAAFLGAVRRSMRLIRAAIGTTTINPVLLTCAERLQYHGYLRRRETNAAIMALVRDGVPLKEIVRRTGHSRQLVRHVSRGQSTDIFRTRQSTLDAHLPFLDAQWAAGCRNGTELWRRLQVQGFQGSLRVVSEWRTRRQRAEKATDQQLQKVPSARTVALESCIQPIPFKLSSRPLRSQFEPGMGGERTP